jgi:hypothetical protein
MASRSPPSSKRGRREDDNDESCHRKKLEKGKEPAAKDADEEPLYNDNKFIPVFIVYPVFDEEGFDSGEETSLRIPKTAQHSKECFVSAGVEHPRNLISYPLYRQTPIDVTVAAHTTHGRASTA